MASRLRQRTRSKRGGSGGSRRGGRASAKRQASANRARRRASQRQADTNRGIAAARASGQRRRSEPQYLTGRDAAARGIATANKEKKLQQSVGSLDRRVEKALAEGNTDLAKDLRSRQNKFVKDLAMERARKVPGGTIQGNVRMSSGDPILTSKGFDAFQETVDQDFIDPTRKLQNLYPNEFGKMYPITNVINRGPFAFQGLQAAFGNKERKQIPYNLDDMPGVRYPLDAVPVRTRSDRQEPLDEGPFTISDRQDPLDVDPQPLPLISVEFGDPLPNQFQAIDPETRSEVMDETMGDIIDSGRQDFETLDEAFQEDQERIDAEKALQQSLEDEVQMQKTAGILQGSGYNLDQNIINDLFGQGLLEEGTNYFPNPRIGTNPLIDEALASYYSSLK